MAVMAILKRCPDCGEVFVAESANGKFCACCSAKRNIPAAARGKGYRKPKPDKLTLDVRAADAAGLSYGVWRAREDEKKRKAEEELRRIVEVNKQRREKKTCSKKQEKEVQDGKGEV